MDATAPKTQLGKNLFNDYGMVFVLLLLVVVLSALTLKEQSPEGEEAGRIVAERIIAEQGANVSVMVVAESTPVDEAFVRGAVAALETAGATVAAALVVYVFCVVGVVVVVVVAAVVRWAHARTPRKAA